MQDNTGSSRTARDALIIELLGDLGKVHDEIKNLPNNVESALIDTIKIMANSAEKLESSAEKTKNDTQAALAALSQKELEETKTKITDMVNESIDNAIKYSLIKVNSDIMQLENKLQSLSSGFKPKNITVMNCILAALVTVTLVGTVIGFMLTRWEIAKSRDDVNFYVKYIQKYTYAIDKLPEKYKKEINDEVLGYKKDSRK